MVLFVYARKLITYKVDICHYLLFRMACESCIFDYIFLYCVTLCTCYIGSFVTTVYRAEPEIKYDGPADIDNNYVERPDQISEPRRRKLSLRASIIGQPGILAGLYTLLCHVLFSHCNDSLT